MRLFTPRPYQTPVLISEAVDDVTISAPQLGKTLTAGGWLFGKCLEHGKDKLGRVWWWTAPTYPQTVHGLRNIIEMARNAGVLGQTRSTPVPEVTLVNGGVIQARSWERPEGMYGPTVLGGVSDEFGWLTAPAYSAISSRRAETISQGYGQWRWIGNVGDIGGPAEDLFRMAERGQPGFVSRRWTWRDRASAHPCMCGSNGAPGIDPVLGTSHQHRPGCPRASYVAFIEREAERMSGPQFRRLYDAEWADWSELPVYLFDRAIHVDPAVQRLPFLPLELSVDFNVDPMCWTVGQHKGDEAWTFDEIVLEGGTTTADACREFIRRYGNHKIDLHVYGDASGKAHTTKSHQSDYEIMAEELTPSFRHVSFNVPQGNPAVQARVDAFNSRLRAANGEVRYFMHPRCQWGADDMARTSWKPGTRDIDKSDKRRTHWSDADGYRMHWLYQVVAPIKIGKPSRAEDYTDPMLGAW